MNILKKGAIMPHKVAKPRKAGSKLVSIIKNRRANRPDPLGGPASKVPPGLNRPQRGGGRPPRFPGRQGGR
jgi:hypothetical protein